MHDLTDLLCYTDNIMIQIIDLVTDLREIFISYLDQLLLTLRLTQHIVDMCLCLCRIFLQLSGNLADSFRKLSSSFGGLSVEGNGMDLDILDSVELKRADTLIAVTDNDNVNIMISQLAKEVFNVRKVIARLSDPQRSCVYQDFGIETICPSVLSARQVDLILNRGTEASKEVHA